jgi:phosphomannomutase
MPEISRFYGIVIAMFYDEHNPPHFHAVYGKHKVAIRLDNFAVLSGKFPPRALGLVIEWAMLHKEELEKAWEKLLAQEPLFKINPLK